MEYSEMDKDEKIYHIVIGIIISLFLILFEVLSFKQGMTYAIGAYSTDTITKDALLYFICFVLIDGCIMGILLSVITFVIRIIRNRYVIIKFGYDVKYHELRNINSLPRSIQEKIERDRERKKNNERERL